MKKFLAEHPEICIVESDKGKKMVVMLRQDYDTKMLDLLNEPNTYKILKTDPTSRIQNTVNNMVKRIAHLGLIDQHTVRTLQTHTATCPRIYGQPKAHKPNLPLRPVVPTITAPTYNLSKFIAKILQQTFTSQYNVADSFTFANFSNQTTIPPDHILVSFDVVSLFTNIPNELVRRSIIFRWTEIKQGTNINLDLFLEMVELCMDTSYFRFRDKYYQQTFGTAMGSPLSPILADYITEDLLETVVKNSDLNIPIVKKYVDDLFLVLPRTEVQNVLDTFNQYNAHLQFTVEKEIDGSLPFLDTLVIRKDNQTLKTSWYSKPISSGRILNYLSFHPMNMKLNVAANFIKPPSPCSTQTRPTPSPPAYVSIPPPSPPPSPTHLPPPLPPPPPPPLRPPQSPLPPTQSSPNQISPDSPEPQQKNDFIYRSLPNIPILSHAISTILKTDYPSVRLATKTIRSTKNILAKVKDPVPTLEHKIIYSIPCSDCSNVYIGMTTNYLKKRLSGHKSNINKNNTNPTKCTPNNIPQATTALVQHMIEHKHIFDLDSTQILDSSFKTSTLPILEMCHITNTNNTVNYRTDVDGLNATYAGILHTVKTQLSRSKNRTQYYKQRHK
ncbi:LOW QUALITY PROTEIN: protein diaphanous-like [Armigeres subalbatus]|uniref:LOW QUALITY PROTEIN: protein diaphanous-like n=1 Tax=Armigeres subalbatus TaxID=124917 RepID=UPI002ED50A93